METSTVRGGVTEVRQRHDGGVWTESNEGMSNIAQTVLLWLLHGAPDSALVCLLLWKTIWWMSMSWTLIALMYANVLSMSSHHEDLRLAVPPECPVYSLLSFVAARWRGVGRRLYATLVLCPRAMQCRDGEVEVELMW
eukprot:6476899-Amphidinium_carterae.5